MLPLLASMIASAEKLICHCWRIIGVYLCSVYDPPHVARLYPRTKKPSRKRQQLLVLARLAFISCACGGGGSCGATCVYMDLIACQWYYCNLELIYLEWSRYETLLWIVFISSTWFQSAAFWTKYFIAVMAEEVYLQKSHNWYQMSSQCCECDER